MCKSVQKPHLLSRYIIEGSSILYTKIVVVIGHSTKKVEVEKTILQFCATSILDEGVPL
jgi:hypothetical protein